MSDPIIKVYASRDWVEDAIGKLSSQNVNPVKKTDDMTQPVGVDEEGKLFTRPGGESSSGSVEFTEEKTELNNPITDIIGTAVANSYTGKLTHKCVTDTTTVYNGGMLCNDPPAVGVMVGETKFNSSGDGRTETAGTVNVRWITINNTHGKNDFTFTSGDDVEIFAPGGEITRVDGTVVNATTGGFGDQILHDTANNKYIVIAEAFVGSENVVFARVATAESANATPTMEFTAAKELTLTVDGVAYNIKNGLKAISNDYDSVSQYNGDITYVGGLFYWALTNNYKGWVVLTSADGQNWEFNRYIVPDKGAENLFIESAIGYNTNTDTMVIAGRTKTETGYMVLTAYHVSSGAQCTKLIPDCRIGSKPSIAQHKYGYYVGHNIGNRADYELLFVNTYYAAFSTPKFQTMDVWRVNAWHGVSTQYATIRLGKQSSHYGYIGLSGEVGYANLLHCYGMDGNQFNKNGASLTYDAFEFSALTLKNGNQVSLENAYYDKGLLLAGVTIDSELSEESRNAIQNAAVATALKGKADDSVVVKTVNGVFPDENGNVDVSASSGVGGNSFELIGEVEATDGSTVASVELTKNYKRFFVKFVNVTTSAKANSALCLNSESPSATNTICGTAADQLSTSTYRHMWIDAERIVDHVWRSLVTNSGGNMTTSTVQGYHHATTLTADSNQTSIAVALKTAETTFTGGMITFYGVPA